MGKELVRNGGFERGDEEFWEGVGVTSIEVLAAAKKYGVYGCKVISSGQAYGYLQFKDFIAVEPFSVYTMSAWVYNSTTRNVAFLIREYDSDLNQIKAVMLTSNSIGTTYAQIKDYYVVSEFASYIQINVVQATFSSGDYSYVDSVSLREIPAGDISADKQLLISVINETTSHTVYGEEFFAGIWKEAEYQLYCSSLTGTSPTLDVTVQAYDPETAQWRDAMVFQQLTAAGSEYKGLTSALGWKQRIKYVTTGTLTDCDFKVGVVYKR